MFFKKNSFHIELSKYLGFKLVTEWTVVVLWPRRQSSEIQVVWDQENQIEVAFRYFLVCASILKSTPGSLKCVPCSLESWGGELLNRAR